MPTPSLWLAWKRRVPMWGRIVMNRDLDAFLSGLPKSELRAIEISGWAHEKSGYLSYEALWYPEFDVCTREPLEARADVVFCEQVLEHVPDPARALANIAALLRPGGYAVLSVPFLVRIHNEPGDYWRFTPAGLRLLTERAGLRVVHEGDWGNRAAVLANLWFWMPRIPLIQPLHRSEAVPIVVWLVARKP